VEVDREYVVIRVGGQSLVRVGFDRLVLAVELLGERVGVLGRVTVVVAERRGVPPREAAGSGGDPRAEAAALFRDEPVEERAVVSSAATVAGATAAPPTIAITSMVASRSARVMSLGPP